MNLGLPCFINRSGATGVQEILKIRSEVESAKKEGVGGRCFKKMFSDLILIFLITNQLKVKNVPNCPSSACF